jgi:hypothetical protein
MEKIHYKPVYGRLYILLGILFTAVFIAGGIILKDYINFAYAAASLFMVKMGLNMIKLPYAEFDHKTMILYSFWGDIRKKYTFSSKKDLKLIKNRIYHKEEKLKLNAWFLAINDWKRIVEYYELRDPSLTDELIDDTSL